MFKHSFKMCSSLWCVFIIIMAVVPCNNAFLDAIISEFEMNCGRNEFACGRDKCLPIAKRCDGHVDCPNGRDEHDCDMYLCKEPNYFKCKNGKCIFGSFVCDEGNDCGDFSDESNCTNFTLSLDHASACLSDEWRCVDKLCIPKDFVCNGENDCLDGSDETIGCTADIHCDGYKCHDGHCIPSEWRCDGHPDCHDQSDEKECKTHINPKECTLDKNLYLCKDNVTCISLQNVCDSQFHCPDNSDEGIECSSTMKTCQVKACSHKCVQLPTGPKCLCPDGYVTINDKQCEDVNECETFGICDQRCRNTAGSYICSCDDRYALESDKKTCKAIGGEALMIFSSNTEIRGYFLQSKILFPVAKNLKQVVGVGFDGHYIYWTDIFSEHEGIFKALEDGSKRELLVRSGLGSPEDLAVDWITGNIYFSDSEMQHIGVCSNDGTKCTVLVNKDIDRPRGIVLHPAVGEMYWSDWGTTPKIAKSKMDGTEDSAFITSNIHWPNGLAIDYPNERLYWADGKLQTLESIRLDGTDRRMVLEGIVKHPYSIAVFENRLYWSDWQTHSIQSCDKFTGKNHETLITEKREYIYGLHIFHSAIKPRISNPCASTFCSDICLINGPKSYSCACPQDKILSADKHTCKEVIKKQVLVAGARDLLFRIEYQTLGKHEVVAYPTIAKDITAITYNTVNNTLYVADRYSHAIIAMHINTRTPSTLVSDNIGVVSSMDFDYIGGNLYWTDSEKKTVELFNLPTMSRKILLHDLGGETPTSLALIPEDGLLFVAMQNDKLAHIDRFHMDGTARTHVIEQGLIGPVSLHYDATLHRVFWTDAGTGNIESTSADGDDRHAFKALHFSPVGVTTLNKDLFWSHHQSRTIFWADKTATRALNKKLTLDVPKDVDTIILSSIVAHNVPRHACNIARNGNCSHICMPSTGGGAQCACPLGMSLADDHYTCIKRKVCATDEFYCTHSDICILKSLTCNGHFDCLLGEDEQDCVMGTHCSRNQFQCRSGDCIRKHLVCDHHYDCDDRSDEQNCEGKMANSCPPKHFKCSSDLCIHERFMCDGTRDCQDGSDEEGCASSTCNANQFRCLSGACIPKNWECDQQYDCPDASDEHAECVRRQCNTYEFQCQNGLCIDAKLKCDKLDDCGDGSDERGCVTMMDTLCAASEYQCTSDTTICLPPSAKCNGTSECPHHEDEQGCSDCHIDDFECDNRKCVSRLWVCDGSDDCGDGSDESFCNENNNGTDTTKSFMPTINTQCDNGFRCKSGACIDYALVCNGEENCYDGSDENGACNSSCKSGSNPCDHICKPTPSGPACLCNQGYQLSGDGHSCNDIPECSMEPPVCSQLCLERIGGYTCGCYDQFIIKPDKKSCKSTGPQMSFIYTIGNEIRQLNQMENTLRVINREESPRITGLDVTSSDNYVYYCIEEAGTIHRLNLLNNTKEYIKGIGRPQKLAVDWLTHNVYYVDATNNEKAIRMCNFITKRCAKIADIDVHSQVTSLTIDGSNKYMFYVVTTWWVFNNPMSTIYKTNLDGKKQHEIVKSHPGYVTGLTYDHNSRMIYYVEHHHGVIWRLNYDGSERTTIFSNLTSPYHLSLYEDHLYLITSGGYMSKCQLYGERICTVFRLNGYGVELFAISQVSRQPMGKNVCASNRCAFLCVPSDLGARCLCESGAVVEEGVACNAKKSSGLNPRRPTFGVHPVEQSDHDASIVAGVVIPFLLCLTGVTAYFMLRKRNYAKFNVSMRFQNPIYGLRHSGNETEQPMLQPGEHEYCNPIDLNQQKELQNVSNAILEKVSPLIKIDN